MTRLGLLVAAIVSMVFVAVPAAVAAAPPGALAAPASVLVNSTSPRIVTVTWTPPADGDSGVTGYLLTRDGTDINNYGPWSKLVSATSRSYTLQYLRLGTYYTFSVAAVGPTGTGPAVSRTLVLGQGSTGPLVTTTTTGNSVTMTWTVPTVTNGPVIGYRLKRDGTDRNGYGAWQKDVGPSPLSFTLRYLQPKTSYLLEITAYTAKGPGPTVALIATTKATIFTPPATAVLVSP